MTALAAGTPAPEVPIATDQGEVSLAALKGKPVVVYFYPKDDTPGCTREAKGFSCLSAEFEAAGATVIGISPDSVERHAKFRAKHAITFALGSDPDHKIAEAFGAWDEKSLYGRIFFGVVRSTFLIGRDGVIARTWPKVKVDGHAEAVLEAVRSL